MESWSRKLQLLFELQDVQKVLAPKLNFVEMFKITQFIDGQVYLLIEFIDKNFRRQFPILCSALSSLRQDPSLIFCMFSGVREARTATSVSAVGRSSLVILLSTFWTVLMGTLSNFSISFVVHPSACSTTIASRFFFDILAC